MFWEVVGLERGPFSLVSTIEELLGRKYNGSSLENREYGRRGPSRWPRGTLYPQKLALSSPTSGGRSVGIVRSRTQATKYFFRKNITVLPNHLLLDTCIYIYIYIYIWVCVCVCVCVRERERESPHCTNTAFLYIWSMVRICSQNYILILINLNSISRFALHQLL
jgi:hypothetical protein